MLLLYRMNVEQNVNKLDATNFQVPLISTHFLEDVLLKADLYNMYNLHHYGKPTSESPKELFQTDLHDSILVEIIAIFPDFL